MEAPANSFLVGLHRIPAVADTGVHRVLHHVVSIAHQKIPELRRAAPLRLGFDRQVEYHQPHQTQALRLIG